MSVLLETSVLFPALTAKHPRHTACRKLLTELQKEGKTFILNTHLIAELYSNLTRIPALRISPDAARKALHELARHLTPIDLNFQDYLRAVDRSADLKLVSGVVFDALHIEAAIKAKVDVLYTNNLRDFARLLPEHPPFLLQSA